MSNKKIYKNRLSLPIFDNKGIGNGNGIAYIPNVIRGGSAIPIGNNMFLMRGRSHAQGGIDIGRDLEVEGNEVVQNGKFGTKVFSSVPFLRGVSPAQRVLRGENPDVVFAAQENWKRINKINDDGSRKARKGKYITNPNVVQSDNTRVAPILNNPPKSKEIRQGDFLYTPKQLVLDDEKGFVWQPASKRVSQIPLERIYPEFDVFMLPRVAANYATSPILQLERELNKGLKNIKIVNKPLKPKVRTRVGDIEIDNPELLYHLDRGDGVGAFSDKGAYVEKGKLFPGTIKEGKVPYSWWNLGRPYVTSVNGQPMTRLITATKDTPGMLNVRSQNYPIGQWNGKSGFVTNFEYVNHNPVDVSNSTYILNPSYGWKKISSNNKNLRNIFDIKNDLDFYNAANEFANKYGYETFDKSLIDNGEALEDAVKQMLNRHNTFYRGVVGDDATKRIAIDTPWKEGEGIWITPQADYAQLYGQVGKLQRPYKLSSNRNNWFKDADFDYTFADDNVGLINPWQRNPKLYENTIIDKSVPHEIYAKDKLNFVDWVKDVKNAKGSNNIMNYKKFGGHKAALGINLFRPTSFRVQELPIDNFLANSINREIETPEVPTYVLKDDEKPVGKKVNSNIIGGGRLYNGYAVDNHEGENINGIGGSRVYTAKPIDEFATDSVSFGDIKSPRGFREQDADYIYDYLSKHSDLTDTAKAAILATAAFESGMNHKARNKYSTAKGYFQWLNDRYIPTPGLSDEQEKIAQLNKIIDDMTPVKGKAKGWTQTKTRNIFDLANEFRTTDDIDRAVEIITRHHIRPSLGEEPRKNKQGIEIDKGYKWEIAERRKVARQFYNRMFNRKNKKEFGGMKLNIFKLGGLSRSKDYGSKDKPYPSVNKNDFAGGGRSYPIPTRADAVDALRLAGLHHRSDVRAKVYAKYPDLRKKAAMGTIDEEDLQDLLYQQRMNSKRTNNTSKTVRNNYVEKTNNDLATNIGKGIVGSLIGGSTIFGLNKVAKNYTPSLSKNNRFVSPNYDIVENPTDFERKYNYPKRVANRIKNSGVEELWDSRRLENATKRVNAILDKYGDKIKIVNEPVAKEISSTQVYDVAKPKKYTPNLSEFSPEIKAGVQKVNKQNLNLARRLGTNIRNIGGILGKALPGFAFVDFVRNLFPSKQEEQEADKAWRRYKSPTGRISEDYQMKFGGRKKAPFGDYITIGGRRVPLVFDTNNRISDQVLSLMYPAEETGTERLPIDFNRLSLLDTNSIGTRGSSPYGLPSRLNSNGSYFPINFDRLGRANVNPTYVFNDVLGYTGNINGRRVLINPSYMRQVPRSVRRAVLNNTPEVVRGASSIRRNVDDNNALSNARPQYYAEENRNMYPELNNNFGLFRYGWSHNGNNRTISPAESLDAVNRIAGYDLSTYFNNNNNSRTPRRTQPVRVRTERVGNVPEAYREFRRPNLTQLGTQGIGLNMPAYTSPFTPATTSGTRTYDIGVPTTLDTSRLDSILSKYGVTPISSSTGNGINPADVEAVRSGNFKAIDNDRYVPIRTTTEDWVGLGANLLGSIGSYLGTRAMLNRYPMPSKPVPAIAQKLKTRFNINSALDQIREQAGTLGRMVDNNTASSRVAQARKQGISNNATASTNQQYNQKENIETQLINQDIMNRQRIGLYNNQIYNYYLNRLGSARQYVASGKINNINNLINGTNQSIQDLLGRIDDRDANLRNFIFMEAAYPNVNWRNIFGNPELARSLGFRFV